MTKIVFYTASSNGTGQLFPAAALQNAIRRNNIDAELTLICHPDITWMADLLDLDYTAVPYENEHQLSKERYESSILYQTLHKLQPDVLLVWLSWFTLYHFIETLPAQKFFLTGLRGDRLYKLPLPSGEMQFNPDQYDIIIQNEPANLPFPSVQVNPIIIMNRDEIMPRDKALEKLELKGDKKICFLGTNGLPGEFENIKKTYSYLEDEGYEMFYSTNFKKNGIIPAADYFNAFDLLITGAGYNAFWEAIYFKKEAIFIPINRPADLARERVEQYDGFEFDENGADQLAEIIAEL